MAAQTGPLQFRRLTNAQLAFVTPAPGEPVMDKTLNQLHLGDGVTVGGVNLANAATAAKLATPRTVSTTGAVTGSVSFDGSADVAISTTLAPSPALTGVPTAPTALVDTSTTQVASTAFVIGQASSSLPIVDGTAAIGTSSKFARADHVHPTDTSRAPTAAPTFTGIVTVNGGNIKFPSTAVPSADPNTLDDYKEGTWVPVVSYATPGNLSITYANQVGSYTKIGREVTVRFNITTSAFTFTTASGALQISGLPYPNNAAAVSGSRGSLDFGGITKASYTHYTCQTSPSLSYLTISCSGSGQSLATLTAADTPSGGTLVLIGTITYMV